MDILKCKAFIYSVDSGSFSLAGEKLGYTPSGITRMVNALEDEMGFPLLIRSHSGVTLNEDGKKIIPFIREIIYEYEKMIQIKNEIKGLSVGNLTIGTYSSVAICWLPEIIKRFEKDYPNIKINILEGGNSYLMEILENKIADLCFLSECEMDFQWIPLKKDELVVWLPYNHPKSKDKSFPIKELNNAPFIKTLPNKNTDIERLFIRENIKANIKFTTVDNYSTYAMVSAGLGISLNNKLMSKNWSGNVVTLPFEPPQYITLGIALPSLEGASLATRKFIDYTKKYLKDENTTKEHQIEK